MCVCMCVYTCIHASCMFPVAFLTGCPQHCQLTFLATDGTAIPEAAPVRVVTNSNVVMEWEGVEATVVSNDERGSVEYTFTLPAVPTDSSHDCHVTLTLPDKKTVHETLQDHSDHLLAWKHQV